MAQHLQKLLQMSQYAAAENLRVMTAHRQRLTAAVHVEETDAILKFWAPAASHVTNSMRTFRKQLQI